MSRSTNEQDKLDAEVFRIYAEGLKLRAEAKWYPLVVITAFFAAALALGKFFAS